MMAITATTIHGSHLLRSSFTRACLPSPAAKIATGRDETPLMRRTTVQALSRLHTIVYRTTNGFLGPRLAGIDVLLLTTLGNRTGKDRTVPLLYLRDGPDFIVVASYGGRPHHPDWYLNLMATPEARIQVDDARLDVRAETLDADERSVWWDRAVDAWPDYDAYQGRTDRQIPLVRLRAGGLD